MPLLSPESLARTYSPTNGRDGWGQVQLYRQTQRYSEDWGGARIATAINGDENIPFDSITRSNIRAWVESDGKPDAARALEVAESLGWLAKDWSPTTRSLATLVAGVFACGSVNLGSWVPGWAVESGRDEVEAALLQVGVGYRRVSRESKEQADEVRPRKHSSILGRALVAAGAPIGDKNADSVSGLPDWLDDAPPSVRATFAEFLVQERATVYPGKATRRIVGSRDREYFEDVRELLEDVTGERVTASDAGVTISADAVRALGLT